MEDEVEVKERDDETGGGSEDFESEGEYEEEPTAGCGACETRSRSDSAQRVVESAAAKSEEEEEEEEHLFGKVTSWEAAAVDLVMMVYELLPSAYGRCFRDVPAGGWAEGEDHAEGRGREKQKLGRSILEQQVPATWRSRAEQRRFRRRVYYRGQLLSARAGAESEDSAAIRGAFANLRLVAVDCGRGGPTRPVVRPFDYDDDEGKLRWREVSATRGLAGPPQVVRFCPQSCSSGRGEVASDIPHDVWSGLRQVYGRDGYSGKWSDGSGGESEDEEEVQNVGEQARGLIREERRGSPSSYSGDCIGSPLSRAASDSSWAWGSKDDDKTFVDGRDLRALPAASRGCYDAAVFLSDFFEVDGEGDESESDGEVDSTASCPVEHSIASECD